MRHSAQPSSASWLPSRWTPIVIPQLIPPTPVAPTSRRVARGRPAHRLKSTPSAAVRRIDRDALFTDLLAPRVSRVCTQEGCDRIGFSRKDPAPQLTTEDGGAAPRSRGRDQRADPGSHGLLQLRWLESVAVRRHPRPRDGGCALLHPEQGPHHTLARPEPRWPQPRIPPERLTAPSRTRPGVRQQFAIVRGTPGEGST